jgi:hypothetical protein
MLNQASDQELRAIWRLEGGQFHGPVVETGTMPEDKLLKLLRELHFLRSRFALQQTGAELLSNHEGFEDFQIEHQQAWSLSSRLAAIPEPLNSGLPQELADLIAEARQLHPEMAIKARERSEAES